MARKHITIEDLDENAVEEMTEDDVLKVTGGASFRALGDSRQQTYYKVVFKDLLISSYQTGGTR